MFKRLNGFRVSLSFTWFVLAMLLTPLVSTGAVMKAGVARVDITPATGVPMWGYFDRLTPAQGTLDPLYARVLVLEVGDQRMALVDLDLGRTFGPACLDQLHRAAMRTTGSPTAKSRLRVGMGPWRLSHGMNMASHWVARSTLPAITTRTSLKHSSFGPRCVAFTDKAQ